MTLGFTLMKMDQHQNTYFSLLNLILFRFGVGEMHESEWSLKGHKEWLYIGPYDMIY
jgi:hypothetical protein